MHNQQINQKYQYYLNEAQRLNEELQEERAYIDLLESIISEILTAEDIDVLAEGEKRAKRIQASIDKAAKRLKASEAKSGKAPDENRLYRPDENDTSPEAMAARAHLARIGVLAKPRDIAMQKLRRRVSKGLEEKDSLPTGRESAAKSIFNAAIGNLFRTRKQIDDRAHEKAVQYGTHAIALQKAFKNRINPESTTSGSNAPKTAAKALEGGASQRDTAALLQRTTRDVPNNSIGARPSMPKGASERIVKQVVNRKK